MRPNSQIRNLVISVLMLCEIGCLLTNVGRVQDDSSKVLKVTFDIPQEYVPWPGQPFGARGLDDDPRDGLDGEAHFHVLIENISSKPIYLYREGNSTGCRTLSLEIIKANGKKVRLCNEQDEWTANMIIVQRLNPGESQVREVYYATNEAYLAIEHHSKPAWHSWGTFPFGAFEKVTLRA